MSGITKNDVKNWETVATYVSTFPDGACDVSVQVGSCAGIWFVRTTDDAGGSDEFGDKFFHIDQQAVYAAVNFAKEHDEAEDGETAEEYLEEKLREKIGEPSEDGLYSTFFVSTDEEYQCNENYDTAEQALARAELDDRELNERYPGGNLLCGYEARVFRDGKWECLG
jgi:hypothetical protein